MPKRKYTMDERARMDMESPKYKKYDQRGPKIREEYIDLSEDRPRKRAYEAEEEEWETVEETDPFGWAIAGAVALIIVGLIL